MAVQVLEKVYEGATLSTVTSNVIYFRLPCDCDISDIRLIGTGFNSGLGNWLFNVSIAGANVFSGAGRITFNSSTNDVTKSSLGLTGRSQGDIVVLNLEQSAAGVIQSPLTLLITIDDGLSSGGTGGFFGQDKPPTSPHAKDDEFPGSSLDGAWLTYGASDLTVTVAESMAKLSRLSNSNGKSGIAKTIPSGDWDIVAKFITPSPVAVASGVFDFGLIIFEDVTNTAKKFYLLSSALSASDIGVGGLYKFTDRTTFDSTVNAYQTAGLGIASLPYGTIYYRLNKTGTSYQAYMSLDGSNWAAIVNGQSLGFTPLHVGIYVDNTSGVTRAAYCDFVRFYTTMPDFIGGEL